MTLPGRVVRTAARRLRKAFGGSAVILMYHRINEFDVDPWGLCVTPAHFAEQLAVLRDLGCAIPLQDMVCRLQARRLPKRAVVLTFDDGYADNLLQARPLLEQYDVPATVFLTAGHLGQDREFWWDALERLMLSPGTLPEVLALCLDGKRHTWELGTARHYTEHEQRRDRDQRAWEAAPGTRLALYYALWQCIRTLPHEEQQQVLEELRRWAASPQHTRPTHRPLAPEEVRRLGDGTLVELGAHTMSHPFLSAQPLATQQEEIVRSKQHLEDIAGRPVQSFAYPYGDYAAETRLLVQEAGFTCACSTEVASVWSRTDRYQVPRFPVLNWNGETFAERLRQWWQY